ncbi:MAG: putative ABC transporter permease [Clostridiales bacterium]|nr:putative ABC transporter permease [Clostridiales bacterium]
MLPFPFLDSMIMYFVYGFIGWIVEVIYYGITEGRFINRGFLNGPHCPVYGLGFYGVVWFFQPVADSFPLLFFGSAFTATAVELLAGVILYAIFHLRWWDYSDYKYNFKGFICLRFAIYWGIACSLGMYLLFPLVHEITLHTPEPVKLVFVIIMSGVLIVDLIVSVASIFEFNKKVRFVSSISGGIRLTSDKLGSKIYDTVDTIVTKTSPAVETTTNSYNEFRTMYTNHRNEEKELARKNRAEERALLGSYVKSGKETLVKTKDAAGEKIISTLGSLKRPEIRLLSIIKTNKKDDYDETIRYLKDHYDDTYDAADDIRREEEK